MAVLSPYSSIFTDVKNELQSLVDSGQITTNEQKKEFVRSKGLNIQDYMNTYKEYKTIASKSKKSKAELEKPGFLLPRIALGALGKVGAGIERVGETFAPETTEAIKEKIDLPEPVERFRQEMFFPTHGGPIEEVASELGSYLIPATGVIKGINLGAKGLKLAQGAKALGLGKKTKLAGDVLKVGTGWAVGTTLVERPEDNLIEQISDMTISDEKGKNLGTAGQFIERLRIDPNDTKSAQYLQAFINNLMVEGVFVGTILTGAKAFSKLPVKTFIKKITDTATEYVVPQSLKRFGKEWLTTRRGMNDEGLAILAQREGSVKAAITRAQLLEAQLRRAIRKAIPKKQRTDETMRGINAALQGDEGALRSIETLFPDISTYIKGMRTELKGLSKYVQDEIAEGSLSVTIGKNLDTYLNRSFKIFDDPDNYKHFLKSDEGIKSIEQAKRYFKQQGIPDEDMDAVLRYFTEGVTKGEFNAFLKGLKPRTSQVLKQRKDISPEIRHLWGEVKDPLKNYVNSYTKLAGVISEHKFLTEISDAAIRAGKGFRGKPGKNLEELARVTEEDLLTKAPLRGLGGTTSNVKNPLQDLFLDPSWKKAIDEGMEVSFGDNALMRHWMKLKASTQAMKTIYSIPTHGRNIMGNTFIMLANGTLDPRFWGKGFKLIAKRFRGKLTKEEIERLARYQELGILDSSVHVSSLRQAASEAFKVGSDGFVENIAKRTGAVGRGAKKVSDAMVKGYEAEDNLFKIANFEQQMKAYRKVFPDMKDLDLEKFVAQRTRDTMPNYNMVPKALKALRAAPIGNFLAFPAEMVRNSINIGKYAWKDISGATSRELKEQAKLQGINIGRINEGSLRGMGYKRLAGMASAAVVGDAMVETSKQLMGISNDQEAALNEVVAPWEKGTNKIFLSPIKKDSKGDTIVDYLNLGPIDPYSYIKAPARMVAEAVFNNEDYNEQAINDMLTDSVSNLFSPFGDPSMIIQGMLDKYRGKGMDPDQPLISGISEAILKSLTPGTIDFFLRRYNYERGKRKFGEGTSKYGFPVIPGEVDFPAFLGVKRQRANLSKGLNWNVKKPIRDMNNSKRLFTNEISNYLGGDPKRILNAYKKSQANKMSHAQRLRTLVKAYRALGMDEGDMYMALTKQGLLTGKNFDELMYADQNIFMADEIPETAMLMGEMETKADIPYNEIYDIYGALTGTEID